MKAIKITILLLFLTGNIYAQNCCESGGCYIRLNDISGVDTDEYQNSLKAAACELVQAFPDDFRRDFRVYDFGFYLHNEHFDGNYPAVFEQVKSQIDKPYYLLFGKQTDSTGVYSKIWVEVKLPTTGRFSCPESDYYDLVEYKVKRATINKYNEFNNNPFEYHNAEIAGIEKLKEFVEKIIGCCAIENRDESCIFCSWNTTDAVDNLHLKGFDQEVISIDSLAPIDSLCLCSVEYNVNSKIVEDYFKIEKHVSIENFNLYGQEIDIDTLFKQLKTLALIYKDNGKKLYGIISDNYTLCNNESPAAMRNISAPTFKEIESTFYSVEFDIGIWIQIQYDNNKAVLNVKTKGVGGEILYNTALCPDKRNNLFKVVNKLNALEDGFYNRLKNAVKSGKMDLVYILTDSQGAGNAAGSTEILKFVLKFKIVIVYIDSDPLNNDEFCDDYYLGYLDFANTILHEGYHALAKIGLAKTKGSDVESKYENCTMDNYGYYYNYYKKQDGIGIDYAAIYTEHHIMIKFYLKELSKTMRNYNNNYGKIESYYWDFFNIQYAGSFKLEELEEITGLKGSTIEEIEQKMIELNNNLHNNNNLPCN